MSLLLLKSMFQFHRLFFRLIHRMNNLLDMIHNYFVHAIDLVNKDFAYMYWMNYSMYNLMLNTYIPFYRY